MLIKVISEDNFLPELKNFFPGDIRRMFMLYGVPQGVARGNHRHHATWMLMSCVKGTCRVRVTNTEGEKTYRLGSRKEFLLLRPEDWRVMDDFSEDAVLMILANEYFEEDDYNYTPYT